MKIFKRKLPKVVHPHRRELKFIALPDNIVDAIEIFVCKGNVGNMVQSYIKKYVESGLLDMWERFAGILKFRWTSMKTSKYVNVISLDAKFVAILLTFSAAYACYFVVLGSEIFHCKKKKSMKSIISEFCSFALTLWRSA